MIIDKIKTKGKKYKLRPSKYFPYVIKLNIVIVVSFCILYYVALNYSMVPTKETDQSGSWDMFDEIYCITSPWKKERRGPLMIELKKVGLENQVKFIVGILDREHGHRGAWQSHKNIAIDALKNTYKRILVFEDDISFTKSFVDSFQYKLYELSKFLNSVKNWEYFYFCHNPNAMKSLSKPVFANNFVQVNSWGTVAYAMSVSGMEKLALSTYPNAEGGAVDGVLHSSTQAYSFFPMVIHHVPNFSFTVNSKRSDDFLAGWIKREKMFKIATKTICWKSKIAYCRLNENGKCNIKCKDPSLRYWSEVNSMILHF